MVAASQLSLMPAHVPAERPKSKPVETPALFNFGELDAASHNAAKDSAQNTQGLRVLRGDQRSEAGSAWARILRTERGRDAAKRIVTDFEAAGQPVSLRTVQGWLAGRLADEPYILLADRLYGPGVVAEIYEPDSPAAAASRRARLERLVKGGAA
ncbi:hypothetical protein SAMN02982994_5501 [Azospirillum lipoferum]|nr:hypothetical protein SAMN02982994_5501 [Azospirillum lipoferum]